MMLIAYLDWVDSLRESTKRDLDTLAVDNCLVCEAFDGLNLDWWLNFWRVKADVWWLLFSITDFLLFVKVVVALNLFDLGMLWEKLSAS